MHQKELENQKAEANTKADDSSENKKSDSEQEQSKGDAEEVNLDKSKSLSKEIVIEEQKEAVSTPLHE